MIAACVAVEPFGQSELLRFSSLIRMPPGRAKAAITAGSALLVQPKDQPNDAGSNQQAGVWTVILAGQLHNHRALAVQLGVVGAKPERVYAAALARWGDQADEHCIGHYATIALAPDRQYLRLARSPFQAPPLHFRQDGSCATAAQHPRVLFWRETARPEPDLDRVGQTLVNDASDRFRSWYVGACRLPLGSAVVLRPQGWDAVWHYDLFSRPQQRLSSPAAYVEAARALLDEGVAAALEGASKPAILLSGGLDSPLVAAGALRHLPHDQSLHSYTFGPDQSWPGHAPDGVFVSDFGWVRNFAAQHPRLVTHFETNHGRDFRTDQRALLEATDAAPPMLGLAWIEQSLHEAARNHGCDVMLSGTWGNLGFSSRGPWAFSEYLLTGRWRQLGLALRSRTADPRPLWRQFMGLSLAPWLPRPIWQILKSLQGASLDPLRPVAIRADWPRLAETLHRSRQAGYDFERLHFGSKRAHWQALLAEDGQEQDQYALGMELLHGMPRRDPTAYRPLVEFCWGCPTDVFMREGTDRWLAREMARGLMPEAQRLNRAYGHHFTDWQLRLAPIRDELLDELERMADDPDIVALVDLPRLVKLVESVTETSDRYDPQIALPYQTTLPIGMAAARFIAYAKGRNDI